jgi:hypothetical protein
MISICHGHAMVAQLQNKKSLKMAHKACVRIIFNILNEFVMISLSYQSDEKYSKLHVYENKIYKKTEP